MFRVWLALALSALLLVGGCAPRAGQVGGAGGLASRVPSGAKVPTSALDATASLLTQGRPKVSAPVAAPTSQTATAAAVPVFSSAIAMRHIRYLADEIGVRRAGSASEKRAADYVAAQLRALGYEPRTETFPLPNGKLSRNVVAEKRGASARTLVLGAHLDTKSPSPGANDNASGVGALLAMASALSNDPAQATVQFVFFGSEEIISSDSNVHHLGSRYRVAHMTSAERAKTAGMLSVDVIGYGSELYARNMLRGPQTLRYDLIAYARTRLPLTFRKDPGKSGWSDHEAYELAGIPVAWIESLPIPGYHTTADTASKVQARRVQRIGQLVLGYVASRSEAQLAELRK